MISLLSKDNPLLKKYKTYFFKTTSPDPTLHLLAETFQSLQQIAVKTKKTKNKTQSIKGRKKEKKKLHPPAPTQSIHRASASSSTAAIVTASHSALVT